MQVGYFKLWYNWMKIHSCLSINVRFHLTKPDTTKWSEVAPSCPTLFDPVDCSPPGSSARGILQARILEWVAISFSRGSSQPRHQTQVSCIASRCFNLWATREALTLLRTPPSPQLLCISDPSSSQQCINKWSFSQTAFQLHTQKCNYM